MNTQQVSHVTIRGYVTADLPAGAMLSTPTGIKSPGEVCRARPLLEQIEAARAARERALVVTVDSVGGDMEASLSLYRALRRFSDEGGGTVVVHVEGMAASTSSVIALAGDVVLLAEGARFLVHSAISRDPRVVAKSNADMLAAYLERTTTPPDELAKWLTLQHDPATDRYNCAELQLDAALAFSWADGTGTAWDAHALACAVAAGACCSTPRRVALASRDQAVASIVTDKLAANAVTTAKLDVNQINSAQVITITAPTQFTATIPSTQVSGLGTLATQNATNLESLIGSNVTNIDGGKITTGYIAAARINAISVAAQNITIGSTVISDAWFGKSRFLAGTGVGHGAAWTVTDALGDLALGSWNSTTKRIPLHAVGMAAAGYGNMIVHGTIHRDYPGSGAGSYELRTSSAYTSGNDLCVDLEVWMSWYDGSIPSMVRSIVDWQNISLLFQLQVLVTSSTQRW